MTISEKTAFDVRGLFKHIFDITSLLGRTPSKTTHFLPTHLDRRNNLSKKHFIDKTFIRKDVLSTRLCVERMFMSTGHICRKYVFVEKTFFCRQDMLSKSSIIIFCFVLKLHFIDLNLKSKFQ